MLVSTSFACCAQPAPSPCLGQIACQFITCSFHIHWVLMKSNHLRHQIMRVVGAKSHYWRGTGKRRIRINWIDIGGFRPSIDLVTNRVQEKDLEVSVPPEFMILSARVFLDRSQTSKKETTQTKHKQTRQA